MRALADKMMFAVLIAGTILIAAGVLLAPV